MGNKQILLLDDCWEQMMAYLMDFLSDKGGKQSPAPASKERLSSLAAAGSENISC